MPTIHESHPRHPHTFGGVEIQVPYPFAEGHQLTAGEAKAMNVWLATAIGNGHNRALSDAVEAYNKGKKVADRLVETKDEAGTKIPATAKLPDFDFQAAFDKRFASYELGVSNRGGGGSTSTDPVMVQARSLAALKVKELITRKGLRVRDFQTTKTESGDSKFTELVGAYIASNPWIVDSARAQLAAIAEHEAEGEIDLGVTEDQPQADAA